MTKTELHQKFATIFERLNTKQQEAVRATQGPVMVIAGPGTGKTQILSARIANILLETDFLPENILCLTYTDAGRIAMRKRLQSMIGADSYRVNLHTFHSFCNQVIQENLSVFNRQSVDIISEIESIELLTQLIDSFKKDNILHKYTGNIYSEIKRLQNLFITMKKENFSSSFIKDSIVRYLNDLPTRDKYIYSKKGKGYKKGDVKQKDIDLETEKMKMLSAAVDAFDLYEDMMHQRNRINFEDLILWVIHAFENNLNLRLDYQEKYQYILVDEYQDTNGAQNRILELLTLDVEQPNIFVVGDGDQSIYRFQGAKIENMLRFKKQYKGHLKEILLEQNYRSTQIILNAANALIQHNKNRLLADSINEQKSLLAAHPKRMISTNQPKISAYKDNFSEMVDITSSIENLVNRQGVPPEKIAVIFRENKIGADLLKFFKAKNIPYSVSRKENLLALNSVKKILQILRYIAVENANPTAGDALLFDILHFDLFEIPAIEIAKATILSRENKSSLKHSLRLFIQHWIHAKRPSLFDERPHPQIILASNLLEKWMKDSINLTILQLLENIFVEGKFLDYALKSNDKNWQLEVLRSTMDFIKEEMHRKPDQNLSELLSLIEMMHSQDIHVPLYRFIGKESGVNLLTAHGSKGLEFEYVFIVQAISTFWESSKSSSSKHFKLPDTIFQSTPTAEEDSEEMRRLFYVAITRAEENLQISYTQFDAKQKAIEPSKFIAEITDTIDLPTIDKQVDEEIVREYVPIYLLQEKQPLLKNEEDELVNTALSNFEMNATALNNYLECPLKFYYQQVVKAPSATNENMEFGSAIHHALQKLFEKMMEFNNEFPSIDIFIGDFKWYMHRHRDKFTKDGLKRKLEYGSILLENYYTHNIQSWSKIVLVERFFNGVLVDGIPLKGKIDKIEFNGNSCNVIDYKTGKVNYAKTKMSPPTDTNPFGGDYWRQAVFYKLLVDNYKIKDWTVDKLTFQFIEPDEKGKYVNHEILVKPEDVDIVREQIKDTWTKIQAHDFYTGCGKNDCVWCNMVKENGHYESLLAREKLRLEEETEEE